MTWFTGLATYLVIWWVVLFLVLPFGIRNQQETGPVARGTDPGAPRMGRVGRRMLVTTVGALVVWLVLVALLEFGIVRLDSFGFLPDPGRPLEP